MDNYVEITRSYFCVFNAIDERVISAVTRNS